MNEGHKMCVYAVEQHNKKFMTKISAYEVINCAYQLGFITHENREVFLTLIGWGFYRD